MPRRIRPGGPFLRSLAPTGSPLAAPFALQDAPVPSKSKWHAGFSDVATNLLLTTLAVALAMPRAPLYSTPPKPRAQVVDVAPNLLLTTLGAPVAAPFGSTDWSVP